MLIPQTVRSTAYALLLLLLCLAMPAWADFQAGLDAHKRGDYKAALHELRPLAERGDAVSQFQLGTMYDSGKGVPQDYVTARQWYEKAANQGDALAQLMLGAIYYDGRGVPKDYGQALRWLNLAANQGNPLAQIKLGLMLSEGALKGGRGAAQDLVRAHMWVNLYTANGNASAAELRDAIAKHMTVAQIAEAQKMAREWTPKTR